MDIQKLLANPRFGWDRKAPAPEASIESLRDGGPDNLPVKYLSYLELCNGGGGPIPQEPGTLELLPADQVLGLNRGSGVEDKLPGYFAFATAGDTLFLFDLRATDGARVCSAQRDSLDQSQVRQVAESFSDFLSRAMLMNRSF